MHRPSDQVICGPFHYRLFGLHVLSDLPLPELAPVDPEEEPDVLITLDAQEAGALLAIEGIARFFVSGGSQIQVVPQAGVPERNVRLYLLGSAMGLLLHQRGLLPLHASAVEIGGRAVAFMGPSGSGKSTLAVWFHDRGYRVIADDVCVIGFDEQVRPRIEAGMPRVRLWKDALQSTGRSTGEFRRAWDGDEDWDKFDVPLGADMTSDQGATLAAIFMLAAGSELDIRRLSGLDAATAVIENTYRGRHVAAANGASSHWEASVRLANSVDLFCLSRPRGLDLIPGHMSEILSMVRPAHGQ